MVAHLSGEDVSELIRSIEVKKEEKTLQAGDHSKIIEKLLFDSTKEGRLSTRVDSILESHSFKRIIYGDPWSKEYLSSLRTLGLTEPKTEESLKTKNLKSTMNKTFASANCLINEFIRLQDLRSIDEAIIRSNHHLMPKREEVFTNSISLEKGNSISLVTNI